MHFRIFEIRAHVFGYNVVVDMGNLDVSCLIEFSVKGVMLLSLL